MPGIGYEFTRVLLNALLLTALVRGFFFFLCALVGQAKRDTPVADRDLTEQSSHKAPKVEVEFNLRFQPAITFAVVTVFFGFLMLPLVVQVATTDDHLKQVRASVFSLVFFCFYILFFLYALKKNIFYSVSQDEPEDNRESQGTLRPGSVTGTSK